MAAAARRADRVVGPSPIVQAAALQSDDPYEMSNFSTRGPGKAADSAGGRFIGSVVRQPSFRPSYKTR
jgi:hypothetical protein